jgi:hypothetical protein
MLAPTLGARGWVVLFILVTGSSPAGPFRRARPRRRLGLGSLMLAAAVLAVDYPINLRRNRGLDKDELVVIIAEMLVVVVPIAIASSGTPERGRVESRRPCRDHFLKYPLASVGTLRTIKGGILRLTSRRLSPIEP